MDTSIPASALAAALVYITSQTDEETIIRAADTQPSGFISKPFENTDLRIAIEIALRKK